MKKAVFSKLSAQITAFLFVTFFSLSCANAPTLNNHNTDLPVNSFMRIEITLGEDIRGLGSGFVVKEGPLGSFVLTAEHVCHIDVGLQLQSLIANKPVGIQVRSYDGLVKKAEILKKTKEGKQDLCLMYVEGMHRPAVTFASDVPRIGGQVYIIGAPQGFSSPTDGMVPIIPGIFNGYMTIKDTINDGKYQTYTARISPGNSGGMVVNKYGEVIGNTNFGWFMAYGYADICGGARLDAIKTFLNDIF